LLSEVCTLRLWQRNRVRVIIKCWSMFSTNAWLLFNLDLRQCLLECSSFRSDLFISLELKCSQVNTLPLASSKYDVYDSEVIPLAICMWKHK
jgi:hypothetical protein